MHQKKNRTQAGFVTTHWTMMQSLRESHDEATRMKCLSQICEAYWFPLYAFARHRGMNRHDAEDAVQSFFCHVATEDYFRKAEQERGKLRTFLLTGFTRHMKDIREHLHALKRGGGALVLSLDVDAAEEWLNVDAVLNVDDAVLQFEREWANTMMRKALDKLKEEYAATQKSRERYDILLCYLLPEQDEKQSRKDAALSLGISSDACDKAIQRLRNSFSVAVKDIIVKTLDQPDQETIQEELQQLKRALMM